MGWYGYQDAWYNLPNVDSSTYSFDSIHTCIYNIYTFGSGEIISGRITDAADQPISGVNVTATSGGTYYATTNDKGIYALKCVPSNKNFTVSANKPLYTFVNQPVSTGKSNNGYSTSGNKWGVDFQGYCTCIVDFDDLERFCMYWLADGYEIPADLNHNGFVDYADYSIFARYWQDCCPADWPLE
jgi:hypothetical protein